MELALVGNKTDLINERQITQEEAQDFLDNDPNLKKQDNKGKNNKYLMDDIIGGSQYFEVSAKKPEQVEKMFK